MTGWCQPRYRRGGRLSVTPQVGHRAVRSLSERSQVREEGRNSGGCVTLGKSLILSLQPLLALWIHVICALREV